MPSLKDLRNRIASVKQTRKITSAMKLVAASKLRRAQAQAEASRPYATRMAEIIGNFAAEMAQLPEAPKLLSGNGREQVHLLVVMTADRGLCGGFNSSIVRAARHEIARLQAEGKEVKLLCVGRKGRDMLRREYGDLIVDHIAGVAGKRRMEFADARMIADRIASLFEAGEFDVCTLVFNRFRSIITQVPTRTQIVPIEAAAAPEPERGPSAVYEFEPGERAVLEALLPRNLAVQIYRGLVENAAGEQGARMAAMDNATRNSGEMIHRLTLRYNRTRQAQITKELIEIISGAEAL